jgi:hypothetical protein
MTRAEFHQMLDQHGIVFVGDAAWRVAQLVEAAEREACAKVCDLEFAACWHADAISQAKEARRCADAIRERGDR